MFPHWEKGRPVAVIFQSLVVSEKRRTRINLFDTVHMKAMQTADRSLPLITICSFCHAVKQRAANETWQALEIYFQSGGDDRVRIGHGMCPSCFEGHHARG